MRLPPGPLSPSASSRAKGDWAEASVAADRLAQGATWVYLIKNASGHGLDLIAVFEADGQRTVEVIEVKFNRSRLSKSQRYGCAGYAEAQLTLALNQTLFARFNAKNDRTLRIAQGPNAAFSEALPAANASDHVRAMLEDRVGGLTQEQIDAVMHGQEIPVLHPRPAGQPPRMPTAFRYRLARVSPGGDVDWTDWT